MPRTAPRLLALLCSLLLAPVAVARSDPVHVAAHATHETAEQGGFQEVGCLVENTSGERILVQITATVTYADGRVQDIFRPGAPIALGPGDGFILFIFFAIPPDAALGTATFTCDVRVLGAAGQGQVHSDADTFEVVPAQGIAAFVGQ